MFDHTVERAFERIIGRVEKKSALIGLTGDKLERLLQFDIPALQQLYMMPGNPINYVTTVLEGLAKAEGFAGLEKERTQISARQEAAQNIFTAAVEHVIADGAGRFDYRLNWELREGQGYKLTGQFGALEELANNAIYDKSGQVPAFEIPRNIADLALIKELTELRSGYPSRRSLRPVVKFSPTPDIRIKAVQDRGYVGHDQVTVFTPVLDQQGNLVGENVEVVWFPQLSAGDYRGLALELAQLENTKAREFWQKLPQDQSYNTQEKLALDVIGMSGELTLEQFAVIKRFGEQKSLAASEQRKRQKPYIDDYLAHVHPQITSKGLDLIDRTLNLIASDEVEAARHHLGQIMELIADQQFGMRLFLLNHLEHDTFSVEVKQGIVQAQKAHAGRLFGRDISQLRLLSGYMAAACGFRVGVGSTGGSIMEGVVRAGNDMFSFPSISGGKFLDVDGKGFGEKSCYNCDECGVSNVIDVNKGEMTAYCRGCGADARCN
jgi:hypothetical protein